MEYKLKLVLYYINKFFLGVSLLGAVSFFIMVFIYTDEWVKWILYSFISIVAYAVFKVIYIFRKSKFPVPGVDYF